MLRALAQLWPCIEHRDDPRRLGKIADAAPGSARTRRSSVAVVQRYLRSLRHVAGQIECVDSVGIVWRARSCVLILEKSKVVCLAVFNALNDWHTNATARWRIKITHTHHSNCMLKPPAKVF